MRRRSVRSSFLSLLAPGLVLALGLSFTACGPSETEEPVDPAEEDVVVPEPDMKDMEARVAERLRETRAAVLRDPSSGEAWGRFGMVAHAHELWEEAAIAYRKAWDLDPGDERWPYYLGDVLSVVGTDLEAAEHAFRAALQLRPGYAPAHMRLGRVLVAQGELDAAVEELRKALEIQPDLQPARLTLAQARVSQGKLDRARELLEELLEEQPRHAQALSTLGQVYMRLGRRDDARKVAERARDAAVFNLYSDPLMGQVTNEGVSALLISDRARAFLDNGQYEQAAIGLRQVVEIQPQNAPAHQQLALAYRNLGRLEAARSEMQQVVELEPERADARVQLASLHLDLGAPAAAVPHLQEALELDPELIDARWLLARAMVLTGRPADGVRRFEEARRRVRAAGGTIPSWSHLEWGSGLAQTGRLGEAVEHFRLALAAQPENPQAHFYMGLASEGMGRIDEAVEHYCRSMELQPNPPAGGRLQALGRRCP